jgi:hypothetical protein
MSDQKVLPAARPVEVREVLEHPSPWLPARDILLNLALMFIGGGLFWLVTDYLHAPLWIALVALTVIFGAGTATIYLFRRHRGARSVD